MSHFGYNGLVERTGIKKGTLYAMVSRKQIPHIRLSSRMVLFDEEAIEEWLKEHTVPVEEPKVGDDTL
jgi:excisionase family DNA binding protein